MPSENSIEICPVEGQASSQYPLPWEREFVRSRVEFGTLMIVSSGDVVIEFVVGNWISDQLERSMEWKCRHSLAFAFSVRIGALTGYKSQAL